MNYNLTMYLSDEEEKVLREAQLPENLLNHWKTIADCFRRAQEEEMNTIEKACDLHEDWKTIAILYKQMYDLLAKRYNNPNLKNNNY